MRKQLAQYISGLSVSFVGLILLAVHTWSSSQYLLGTCGLLLTWAGMTILLTMLLHTVFRIHPKKVSTWLLSAGACIMGSFIISGIPIIFATLTKEVLFVSMVVSVAIVFLLNLVVALMPETFKRIQHPYSTPEIGSQLFVSKHYLWPLMYVIVWVFGMIMALGTIGNGALMTPWQSLPSLYTMSVFAGGFLLMALLFSRSKTSILLAVIILQSVLMHIYIPVSHSEPYGGDVWRHIGRVEHVLAEEPIRPILFGTDVSTVEVFGTAIPAVFTQTQQYAYSMIWGSFTMIHTYTSIPLDQIGRWLMPILWGLLAPVLFFLIGYLLFDSRRKGLILSAIMLIPFSLQAVGSLTLPVSFGYLVFLYGLLWLLFAMRGGTMASWFIVWKHGLLLLFVYPVQAIVYIVLASIVAVLRRFVSGRKVLIYRGILVTSLILGVFLIPAVELLAGTSHLPAQYSFVDSVKRMGGELSGWYIASQIRPHDILSGNIIMNHTPVWSFVSSPFSNVRWHILAFQLLAGILALYGMITVFLQKRNYRWHMMLVYNSIVFGGYIIGWYILEGDRQLVRRMDVFVAIGLLTFAWYGLLQFLEILEVRGSRQIKTLALIVSAALVLWVGITAFVSGPDMRVVSDAEYSVATYIADQYPDTTCVLADTYTLLVLESKTASRIVGGGFPIDVQYGQGERLQLYADLLHGPDTDFISRIDTLAPASLSCVVVVPTTDLNIPLAAYRELFSEAPELVGSAAVWNIQLQKSINSITIDAIH